VHRRKNIASGSKAPIRPHRWRVRIESGQAKSITDLAEQEASRSRTSAGSSARLLAAGHRGGDPRRTPAEVPKVQPLGKSAISTYKHAPLETQGSRAYRMDPQDSPDNTSDSRSVGEPAHPRREFGRRLRAARLALGYTQEQMAYALGIQPARYGKYEIGRSEAPFDVLIRIAHLAKVDLDYLIAGQTGRLGRRAEPPHDQLSELVQMLPTAAVVFDRNGRLLTHNALFREQFFAEQPRLLKRGTPQEVMVRSWAYGQGLSEAKIEVLVRARLNLPRLPYQAADCASDRETFTLRRRSIRSGGWC